jgi:hypothetical protein
MLVQATDKKISNLDTTPKEYQPHISKQSTYYSEGLSSPLATASFAADQVFTTTVIVFKPWKS